jgi:hypothetical protein
MCDDYESDYLGRLGSSDWFRCRCCGHEQHETVKQEKPMKKTYSVHVNGHLVTRTTTHKVYNYVALAIHPVWVGDSTKIIVQWRETEANSYKALALYRNGGYLTVVAQPGDHVTFAADKITVVKADGGQEVTLLAATQPKAPSTSN